MSDLVVKVPSVKASGGISIPAIGLGTWQLWGEKCTSAVETALQLGYTHIDTAAIYENHAAIGKAVEGFDRKMLFIVSKVWKSRLQPEQVVEECNKALQQLGTEYLDLYLIHWPSETTPVQETLQGFDLLRSEGKIKAMGVSNFNIKQVEEALACGFPIATNQVEFHPFLYQQGLLEYCDSRKVPITAYCPLARGMVARNRVLKRIGEAHSKTAAQVALRWLLQKGIIAIPKAGSREHLQENMSVFDFKLSSAETEEIDDIKRSLRLVQPYLAKHPKLRWLARKVFNAGSAARQ